MMIRKMRPNSSSTSTSSKSCRSSTLSNVLNWWGSLQRRLLALIFIYARWCPCVLFDQLFFVMPRGWRRSSPIVIVQALVCFMIFYAMRMVRRGSSVPRISCIGAPTRQWWMRSLKRSLQPIQTLQALRTYVLHLWWESPIQGLDFMYQKAAFLWA